MDGIETIKINYNLNNFLFNWYNCYCIGLENNKFKLFNNKIINVNTYKDLFNCSNINSIPSVIKQIFIKS